MAKAHEFKEISNLNGVNNYILVRQDGSVLAHDLNDSVTLASVVVMCGSNCQSLQDNIDAGRLNHICIERSSGNNLLVFSLGRYYLGIVEEFDSVTKETVTAVLSFLRDLYN